jgi:short-subunit dehydrogenase
MKKIIIVGASSGMGKELAILYAKNNSLVGITGRRNNLLEALHQQFPKNIITQCFDNTKDDIEKNLSALIAKLGGLDLMIISSGIGYLNPSLDPAIEKETLELNVTAWTRVADFSFNFFTQQKNGHLAAITSIAAIRGEGRAPAYHASKAYQATYLEGLRKRSFMLKLNIRVTDIQPGFVKKAMPESYKRLGEATVEKASRQIFSAIESKKKKVYITKRWWLVAQVMRLLPDWVYNRL